MTCSLPKIQKIPYLKGGLENFNFRVTQKSLLSLWTWRAEKTLWHCQKVNGLFYWVCPILKGVQIEVYGV